MLTPASPWIGSNKKPAVFSFIAAFNASTSPNGMTLNPGSKGPNPRLLLSSEDKLMAAIVLPWKLSTQAMISAWSSCTPLTSYAQRLAVLIAVSTASAPVFIGRAIFLFVSVQIFSYQGPSWSLWNALDVNVTLSAWSFQAATSLG